MSPVVETILTSRLIGIIRLKRYAHPVEIARALSDGGLRALEFTLSGDGALQAISMARRALGQDAHVGAGTVLTPEDVANASNAGAEFIVTPAFNPLVVAASRERQLPIVCGAFTPTEMMGALAAGADLIKLFPARLGGPQYVRDLLAPFPNLRLVPTGGVSAENAADYLKAGAVAVAIGGNLVSTEDVTNQLFSEITWRASKCVQAVTPEGLLGRVA
jgi:2-dehydro-3-deoxyphosphogluconate aldolase/(4S)-4-hydroxy-2-oxoglutarate aldolase